MSCSRPVFVASLFLTDQPHFPTPDGNDIDEPYPYGITSLADKRDFLQKDDVVKFQVARTKKEGTLRAVNIGALRKFIRAKVDSVKGQVSIPCLNAQIGLILAFCKNCWIFVQGAKFQMHFSSV